jgi:hypothetical protein
VWNEVILVDRRWCLLRRSFIAGLINVSCKEKPIFFRRWCLNSDQTSGTRETVMRYIMQSFFFILHSHTDSITPWDVTAYRVSMTYVETQLTSRQLLPPQRNISPRWSYDPSNRSIRDKLVATRFHLDIKPREIKHQHYFVFSAECNTQLSFLGKRWIRNLPRID